ncbi:MAG: OmpA family protein [Bacteroidota bacterium]
MKSVFFGGGSYYIDGVQIQEIETFIKSVPDLENYQIGISSHTDNIGGAEYNKWLSQMRSLSVIEQLKELNIPEEQIIIKDNGQRNPLYNNNTLRGRLANRRVDIILTPIYF